MVLVDFAKFLITNRKFYGSIIALLVVFALFLERDMNWRFWGVLLTFMLYLGVEFASWYVKTRIDGER